MLFSSITFLYYFLPVVLVLYFLTPLAYRNILLLFTSLFFYGWSEPRIVFLMVLTIAASYFTGLLTVKCPAYKGMWLTFILIFCLGSLGYFKYADFFIETINTATGLSLPLLRVTLPVGISFYTFQVLSYNIDVYRGTVKVQKNFLCLATYITMFPQLVAGPIVRYQDIEPRLKHHPSSIDDVAAGMKRFIYGLAKKVLIANSLGQFCILFRDSDEKSVLFCWLYAAAFTLQIYYDFSGYSDMAIGLGRILGFHFMENFNHPLTAKSITDFWRRWHISLGSWFRDYVYIPLGGSKSGSVKTYTNILIVWSLTGLWHGAAWNFLLWGLYFALLLIVEKKFLLRHLDKHSAFAHLYVILAVMISFVIFNGTSLTEILQDIGGMTGLDNIPLHTGETMYYLQSYGPTFAIAIAGASPQIKSVASKCGPFAYGEPLLLIALLVLVTASLIDGSFNPFLYFRF